VLRHSFDILISAFVIRPHTWNFPVRIAVGQVWQETNTFNPIRTTRADFDQFGVTTGSELLEKMADTNELGGFIQSLRKWPEKPELVGLVRYPAWPSGLATADVFEWIRQGLLASLRAAMPVDAVLLALHGSMAAEEHPDVEGELLVAVREVVGSSVPIVSTLDLHANVTNAMVSAADALVIYHTIPHVDIFETGVRGAAVLRRILIDKARPTTAWVKIPAVFPAERANTEIGSGMSADFKRQLKEWESRPEVICAGLTTVQPWLDIPDLGSSVVITTDNRPELAEELCRSLATQIWQRRREYLPELVSAEEGVRRAHECRDGLTVLSDAADSTTSGAPGDSVWVLKELLNYDWPRPALLTLVDPELVARTEQAGAAATLDVELGGKRDTQFGTRIRAAAKVERHFDGRFVLSGHIGKNLPIDMGRCVVLDVGRNIHIVVTSRSGPHFAPQLFETAGFDPFAASVLIAKSPCGFRAAYAPRAAQIFSIRAPGCAPSDFWNYPYHNIQQPLWPWQEFEWTPVIVGRDSVARRG
jgi:microcystin degradation protein MlrC